MNNPVTGLERPRRLAIDGVPASRHGHRRSLRPDVCAWARPLPVRSRRAAACCRSPTLSRCNNLDHRSGFSAGPPTCHCLAVIGLRRLETGQPLQIIALAARILRLLGRRATSRLLPSRLLGRSNEGFQRGCPPPPIGHEWAVNLLPHHSPSSLDGRLLVRCYSSPLSVSSSIFRV